MTAADYPMMSPLRRCSQSRELPVTGKHSSPETRSSILAPLNVVVCLHQLGDAAEQVGYLMKARFEQSLGIAQKLAQADPPPPPKTQRDLSISLIKLGDVRSSSRSWTARRPASASPSRLLTHPHQARSASVTNHATSYCTTQHG